MFSSLLSANSIPLLEQVVQFSQARHEVLAGNLANISTPGYRLRDLSVEDFQEHLKGMIASRDAVGAQGSLGSPATETKQNQVPDALRNILFHDGSDVSLEHQVAELSKNQFMHNLAISIMGSQFRQLEAAISERV